MKRYRPTNRPIGSLMEVSELGDYYRREDADREIAALREKLAQAEARVAVLTAALRDAIAVCRGIVGAEFPEEMHADVLSGLESSVAVYEAATGPLPAKEGTDA